MWRGCIVHTCPTVTAALLGQLTTHHSEAVERLYSVTWEGFCNGPLSFVPLPPIRPRGDSTPTVLLRTCVGRFQVLLEKWARDPGLSQAEYPTSGT